MNESNPPQPPRPRGSAKPDETARLAALLKPSLTMLIFPDGTRARLSEFETYQPDGAADSPNGILVKLRSGRTLLWSVAGVTAEQKARHAKDILAGLDQIFGHHNLAG